MLSQSSPESWRARAWNSPVAKQTAPKASTGDGTKKKKNQKKKKSSSAAGASAGAGAGDTSAGAGPKKTRRGGGTRGQRGGKNARQLRKHFAAGRWNGPTQGLQNEMARTLGSVRTKPTYQIPIGDARDDASNVEVGMWNCFGLTTERMDYLFGSQDGSHEGIFSATEKLAVWSS